MKPEACIVQRHSNKGTALRQLHRLMADLVLVGMMFALFWVTGCTGLYRKTQAQLPPDPVLEARLRMAETSQAQDAVRRAATRLLDSLQHNQPTAIQAGYDRLEVAAFELDRRILAASDAAARSGEPEKFTPELQKLDRAAQSWLEYVRVNRGNERSRQTNNLLALIDAQ